MRKNTVELIPAEYSSWEWFSSFDEERLKSFARNRLDAGDIDTLAKTLLMIAYSTRNFDIPFDYYARQYCAAMKKRDDLCTKEMCKLWPLESKKYLKDGYSYNGLEDVPDEYRKPDRISSNTGYTLYSLENYSIFNEPVEINNKVIKGKALSGFLSGSHNKKGKGIKELWFNLYDYESVFVLPYNVGDVCKLKIKGTQFKGILIEKGTLPSSYTFKILSVDGIDLTKPNKVRFVSNLCYDISEHFSE